MNYPECCEDRTLRRFGMHVRFIYLAGLNSILGLKLTGQVYVRAKGVSTRLPECDCKKQGFFCSQRLPATVRGSGQECGVCGNFAWSFGRSGTAARVLSAPSTFARARRSERRKNRRIILPEFPVFPDIAVEERRLPAGRCLSHPMPVPDGAAPRTGRRSP